MITDTSLTQATIYFQYYVNQALHKTGLGNLYLDRLQIWKDNLAMGLTTWAEISDINAARSDCHAWGASPNIEFFRTVLGIDTDAPGFNKIRIEPNLGSLTKVSGTMPHPKGEITVSYNSINKGKLDANNFYSPRHIRCFCLEREGTYFEKWGNEVRIFVVFCSAGRNVANAL